ncbi:hypothetical protein [Aeromicrobium sp. 9AM]|uniref:hypothetical protein n=1 Tax=Aeromicrobium sp. 9AM TaxID=2653126 RepID=UPI0012EF8F2B|nr:hypothetical protein [Aeromicrobium sp. 9AM]VXB10682.1 conserved hypothetical protein [Aeromicrobium sp. 9AM]
MNRTDLVTELAKKSGLLWIAYGRRVHPVWHEWVGDAVCVVAGGSEQPLPDIERHETVVLSLRSKATRALVAEVTARVEVVAPESEHWVTVTTALKAGRLNLSDSDNAIDRWARESVVVRLVPTDDVSLPDEIATTIGHTSPHLTR